MNYEKVNRIIKLCLLYYGFSFDEFVAYKGREREYVECRQLVWYFLHNERFTFAKIREVFHNKEDKPFHHANVMYGIKIVENRLVTEHDFRDSVEQIKAKI